jgi:murein DD-endopeptidase MepM/ murein hydrolase activator NlpD
VGINNCCSTKDYYAIDWSINAGYLVYAQSPSISTVQYAGWAQGGWADYGIMDVVAYPYGLVGLYAHLSNTTVWRGAHVDWSNYIGHSGCTGNCTGPHVHAAMYSGNVQYSTTYPGEPYGGQAQIPTPLTNLCGTVYNSLYQGEIVNIC